MRIYYYLPGFAVLLLIDKTREVILEHWFVILLLIAFGLSTRSYLRRPPVEGRDEKLI
ncbi:MAG: hypothetical protein ACXAB4_06945 [Candidatus Hodarchaeales archaeon]|jgi:hypothetical protein